jgi:hypothetical protein
VTAAYPHGTAAGYQRLLCSCDHCRAWQRNRQREITAALKARGLPEGDPRHGSKNGYGNYGCRCAACTEAGRKANAAQREARR